MKPALVSVAILGWLHSAPRADDLEVCRGVFAKNAFEITYKRVKKSTLHEEVRDVLCSTEHTTELWKRRAALSVVLEGVPLGAESSEDKFRDWQRTECAAYVARSTDATEMDSIAQSMVDQSASLTAFVECVRIVRNGSPQSFTAQTSPKGVPKDGTYTLAIRWQRPAPGVPFPVVEGLDVVGGECGFKKDDGTLVPLVFQPGYKVRDALAHTQTCRRVGMQAVTMTLRTTLGSVSARLPSVEPPAPDLVVDRELAFDGAVVIMTHGRIVFRPGGRLRFSPGANVVIRADTITAEEGAPILVEGVGSKGATGIVGERCSEDGCREWWTDNKGDFERANASCLASEYGGKGGQGGPGSNGATIDIYTRDANITGTFQCKVDGGDGGDGGAGGAGRWHVHNTGGTPRYQCGNRGSGERGVAGKAGACQLHLGALADPK